jgi:23S rRNA-/tRNA-specific pseudouridylate synthase
MMIDDKIKKVYFARVRGNFEEIIKKYKKIDGKDLKANEILVENYIFCVSNVDAFWDCNEEMKSIPFEYRTKAKTAITKFKFKFYDAVNDMSVIKCYPLTGRTHQIRVHLKHLGCPIAND